MSEELPKDSPETIAKLLDDIRQREEALANGRRPIIDKSVLLPLGFVLGGLGTVVAVIWFASNINFRVQAAEVRLDKLEQAIVGFNQMKEDVAVIKVQVEGLTKMFSESNIQIR